MESPNKSSAAAATATPRQKLLRKMSVELLDNLSEVKKKTSRSKKTCRALVTLFTERIEAEEAYAAHLSGLARKGTFRPPRKR